MSISWSKELWTDYRGSVQLGPGMSLCEEKIPFLLQLFLFFKDINKPKQCENSVKKYWKINCFGIVVIYYENWYLTVAIVLLQTENEKNDKNKGQRFYIRKNLLNWRSFWSFIEKVKTSTKMWTKFIDSMALERKKIEPTWSWVKGARW